MNDRAGGLRRPRSLMASVSWKWGFNSSSTGCSLASCLRGCNEGQPENHSLKGMATLAIKGRQHWSACTHRKQAMMMGSMARCVDPRCEIIWWTCNRTKNTGSAQEGLLTVSSIVDRTDSLGSPSSAGACAQTATRACKPHATNKRETQRNGTEWASGTNPSFVSYRDVRFGTTAHKQTTYMDPHRVNTQRIGDQQAGRQEPDDSRRGCGGVKTALLLCVLRVSWIASGIRRR